MVLEWKRVKFLPHGDSQLFGVNVSYGTARWIKKGNSSRKQYGVGDISGRANKQIHYQIYLCP
jgi:hypothetical protein